MIAGFTADGQPQLYLTDPGGTYSAWKACAMGGRNEKAVKEFLEKNWTNTLTIVDAQRMAIKALLEVVDAGAKHMEIAVIVQNKPLQMMSEEVLQVMITEIEKEQEDARKAKEAAQEAATQLEDKR